MAGTNKLCGYCAKVPLDKDALTETHVEKFNLGPWSRVFASPCPLCRLVRDACTEDYRTNPFRKGLSSEDAILVWSYHEALEHRAAFAIDEWPEQHICFAASADGNSSDSDEGFNYLLPSVESELDFSRVSRWISTCTTTHGNDCALSEEAFSTAFPGLRVLRLIDVRRGCLVEVQEYRPYVALSYVWGAVSNFRLTKSNLAPLLVPGTIGEVFSTLPKTICDAITLCIRLGVQYLWVDTLCLLQNDEEDLERGINVMDQIYERSWLTVVAGCGSDANAGLPGVQIGSRSSVKLAVEVKPGVRLGLYTGLDQLLKNSVYNSRGWTSAEFSESCIDRTRVIKPWYDNSSLLTMAVHLDDPLDDYSSMLMYYTARVLADQNDVLRAMAGIIRRISDKTNLEFLQGLPTGALDCFVIFRCHGCILRRRKGFPSYSWCGWRGRIGINMPFKVNEWLTETWIVWYKRSRSGVTSLVWDPESIPADDESRIGYRARNGFQSPVALDFPTTRTTPTEIPQLPAQMPPYPVLQFWTLAVYLKLRNVNVFTGICRLERESGVDCGEMSLDGFEETDFFSSQELFEVILLSPKYIGWSDPSEPRYNAMLVSCKEGLSARRGRGYIRQSMIKESFSPGPIWKEVILA
ncbi:hypothetical protein LCI18_008453 [Fusarium solani-melongenae]|uniref:Uncharacterized protein n=1 Tax=Fusarium solani subsp. cucurbitae TaxID=2747967 RepID=A0ACD3ZBR4_FUSSC|nr:hypothetical protein LCI18_008453 [Fusarium solani-melongenae]